MTAILQVLSHGWACGFKFFKCLSARYELAAVPKSGSYLSLGIPGVPVGPDHAGLFPYDPAKAGLLLRFLLIIIVASV